MESNPTQSKSAQLKQDERQELGVVQAAIGGLRVSPRENVLMDASYLSVLNIKYDPRRKTGRLQKVNVDTLLDCFRRHPVRFRVKRVVSPFEFYLECTFDPISGMNIRHYFSENMAFQKFYNQPRNQLETLMFEEDFKVGYCYACYFPVEIYPGRNPIEWHRIRILEIFSDKGEGSYAKVFFFDLGFEEVVQLRTLRYLEYHFVGGWQSQLYRCYLYDIVPESCSTSLSFEKEDEFTWSEGALQYFQTLMMENERKEVIGLMVERSKTRVKPDDHLGVFGCITHLGLVVFEKSSESNACSINSTMVDQGFAKSIGVLSGCPHQFQLAECTPYWNDEHFLQVNARVKEPPQSPTTSAPIAFDLSPISKEKLHQITLQAVEAGKMNPNILILYPPPPLPRSALQILQEDAEEGNTRGMPQTMSQLLGQIVLSYLDGPDRIFVHFRQRMDSLYTLQWRLEESKDDNAPLEITRGTFLACYIQDGPGRVFWVRAVALNTPDEQGYVKVIAVDHGNFPKIHQQSCRPLPEYFQNIPSFAVRCHMDPYAMVLPYEKKSFKNHEKSIFKMHCISWEPSDPNYFICQSNGKSSLELKHFEQPILYDHKNLAWTTASVTKDLEENSLYTVLSDMNDHPMLKSLFTSFAAEIFFEVRDLESHCFVFRSLGEFMCEREIMAQDECKQMRRRQPWIHNQIANQFQMNRNRL